MLAPAERRFYELYLEGVNAYIATRSQEQQFGFGLLGIQTRTLDPGRRDDPASTS